MKHRSFLNRISIHLLVIAALVCLASTARADVSVPVSVNGPGAATSETTVRGDGSVNSFSVRVNFNEFGNGSWASDLLIGIVAPNGAAIEFGRGGSSLDGYDGITFADAGTFSGWNSSAVRQYTQGPVDLSSYGLGGAGTYRVIFRNAWDSSLGASWSGTVTIDGISTAVDCNTNGVIDTDEVNSSGLVGAYYPDLDFGGTPIIRIDPFIDFDWGTNGPFTQFGQDAFDDTFSVRWSGYVMSQSAGTYTFTTRTDDGVRLWVNGQQLVDDWTIHAPSDASGTINLSANTIYPIVMEYFEQEGGTKARLRWTPPGGAEELIPATAFSPNIDTDGDGVQDDCDLCNGYDNRLDCQSNGISDCFELFGSGLLGTYYTEPEFAGTPISRIDETVDFDWGTDKPLAEFDNGDTYSVRWSGSVISTTAGSYTFTTRMDDRAQLWVDGQQIINDWNNGGARDVSGTIDLAADTEYSIRMDYYEHGANAVAQLRWTPPGDLDVVIPTENLVPSFDCNENGVLDACDADTDGDGIPDACDNCPSTSSATLSDSDGDGYGDPCDICPGFDDDGPDVNGDGVPDACHVCDTPTFDLDGDRDIDLADFTSMHACITGPGSAMGAGCDCFDYDNDNAVTMHDYAIFQAAFRGADILIEAPGEIILENIKRDGSTAGIALFGEFERDLSGFGVGLIGDLNDDGFGELLVGAPSAGTGDDEHAGRAYVIWGATGLGNLDLADVAIGNGGYAIEGWLGGYNHNYPELDIDNSLADPSFGEGGPQGEAFGFNVKSAGDFDGDGIEDMVISAPFAPANGDLWGGRTYVLYGGEQDGSSSPYNLQTIIADNEGMIVTGDRGICTGCGGQSSRRNGDMSGYAIAGQEDFNGDGLADVMIGAPNHGDTDNGRGYVVFGTQDSDIINLRDLNNGGLILDASENGQSGYWADFMGDLNGDGQSEAAVLTQGFLGSSLYLVNGRDSGSQLLNFSQTAEPGVSRFVPGPICAGSCTTRRSLNQAMGGGGDFNGDGRADFAMASDVINQLTDTGIDEVLVVFGMPSTTELNDGDDIFGPVGAPLSTPIGGVRIYSQDFDSFGLGSKIDLSHDLNGDGFDDLIFSANGQGKLWTYVIFGGVESRTIDLDNLNLGVDGLVIYEDDGTSGPGLAISTAGDVNGDGLHDLAIGAPYDNVGADETGTSYLIYGADFTGAITQMGNENNNSLTGTNDADNMVGGRGSDSLVGNGGEDTFYGGAGDDTIIVTDMDFRRVRGGTGFDMLDIGGIGALDTRAVRGRIGEIEKIDMQGGGADLLNVQRIDLVNMSPTSNVLLVDADADDRVFSLNEEWINTGNVSPSVRRFQAGHAELWISQDAQLRMSPVIGVDSVSVDEETAFSTRIGDLNVTDPDGDGINSVQVVGGTGFGLFAVATSTHELFVTGALDYDTQPFYTLEIEAMDGEGDVITKTIDVNLLPVNEAPTLTLDFLNSTIEEHAQTGLEIGGFTASDVDADDSVGFELDFDDASLQSPAPAGSFAIGTNGVLTVADGSQLDYESASTVGFMVYAQDAGGLRSPATLVSITLTDVTEWTMPIDSSFVTSNASMWSNDGMQSLLPITWDVRFNLDSPDQGIELFGHTFEASVSGTVDLTVTSGWDPGGVDASIPLVAGFRAPDEIVLGQPTTVQFDFGVAQNDVVLGGRTPSIDFDVELDVMDLEIQSTTYDLGPESFVETPSDRLEIEESRNWTADFADDGFASTTSDEVSVLVDADQTNWDSYLAQAISAAGLPSNIGSFETDVFGLTVLTEYVAWTFNLYGSLRVEQAFHLEVERFNATMVIENDDEFLLDYYSPTQITLPADADVDGDGRVEYEVLLEVDTLFTNDSQFFGTFGSTFDAGAFEFTASNPACSACPAQEESMGPLFEQDAEYDISLEDNTPGPWPNDETGQFPLGGFNTIVVSGAFDLAN